MSEHQSKASQYTTPIEQGSKALEQQVLQHAPESELLWQPLTSNSTVYGEYEVVRSVLLHGEYERLSQGVAATDEHRGNRQWQSSLLFEIGKTYQIAGKWQGSVLLLYNFRHRQRDIHTRPWVVRFGFQRKQ